MRLTNEYRRNFVRAVMSDVPYIDYQLKAETLAKDWLYEYASEKFPGINLDKVEHWLNKCSVHLPGSFSSIYTFAPRWDFIQVHNSLLWEKLVNMHKDMEQQKIKLEKLKSQLEGIVARVNTTKALGEALPEFSKYLPREETKAKNLPATTGIVDLFISNGWPKETK